MASFDIDSLFTNVPLDETIDICVKKLFGRKRKFEGFTKEQFKKLLSLAVKNSCFLFNGEYYEQVDGVAMGSPLGPTLANIFLCHHEERSLGLKNDGCNSNQSTPNITGTILSSFSGRWII